jgi:hypothetical protein
MNAGRASRNELGFLSMDRSNLTNHDRMGIRV